MNFDWSQYFVLAQELAGQPSQPPGEEARLRSAVGRAYYAAFCTARNHLRDKEGHSIPSSARAHECVIKAFKKGPDTQRCEIGENLARLREHRNKAEYKDLVCGIDKIAAISLQRAARVLSALSGL